MGMSHDFENWKITIVVLEHVYLVGFVMTTHMSVSHTIL